MGGTAKLKAGRGRKGVQCSFVKQEQGMSEKATKCPRQFHKTRTEHIQKCSEK